MDEFRTLFQIPAANLEKFEANIAKLSKRAVKLGLDPILPFIASNELVTKGFPRPTRVYNVHLMCDVPKLAGWSFAGRLDHSQETGTIVRSVPNFATAIPEHYRTALPACDHCNVRRYRRDSYLVCDDAGTFKQVGSTCLADFMGHDAYRIAKLAEFLGFASDYARQAEQFVGADHRFIDVEEFLWHAAWAVRKFGWVSVGVAREKDIAATRTIAIGNLLRSTNEVRQGGFYVTGVGFIPHEDPSEADMAFAAAASEHVRAFAEKATLSDYESNALVIAKSVTMEPRHVGLAASIVGVYTAHLARQSKPSSVTTVNSKHLGLKDERMVFGPAQIIGVTTLESDFGTKVLYTFVTEGGDMLKWFSTKSMGLLRGQRVHVVGTVKKHDEYKGVKQTTLTRCKVDALQAEAA